MINVIDRQTYYEMLENGVHNISKNRKKLNDLNVFPVPDGDTGTNMLMTLKYALDNCKKDGNLGELTNDFASLAVFGARGNSGVILSQFFKGIASGFDNCDVANAKNICVALEKGCEFAYHSVAKPVEGTMLTVVREATQAVKQANVEDVKLLLQIFVEQAKDTLQRTPEMLPILKKAGVVDSGGQGIVCFFEGMLSYLLGTPIEDDSEEEISQVTAIDYSLINKDTPLNYGFCMEGLIQLAFDEIEFSIEKMRKELNEYGNSIVASIEKDKIKIHIHTKKLAKTIEYCQKYGEFLTLKTENMSVQNIIKKQEEVKFLVSEEMGENFNIVAVATNVYMQKKFIEMGADVVILTELTPSSQDFITAFSYLDKEIIVFPNSANSILAAVQAAGLSPEKQINVVNSRSVADCYSALSVLDFDTTTKNAVLSINQSINALYKTFIYHSLKDIRFSGKHILKNEFFSLVDNEKILCIDDTLEKVALQTVKKVVKEKQSSMLTIVYAEEIAEEFIEHLCERINSLNLGVEIATVCSMENAYSLILVFE